MSLQNAKIIHFSVILLLAVNVFCSYTEESNMYHYLLVLLIEHCYIIFLHVHNCVCFETCWKAQPILTFNHWITLPTCFTNLSPSLSFLNILLILLVFDLILSAGMVADAFDMEKPIIFTHEEILSSTDAFSDSNLLGHGTYGSVYYGVLRDQVCSAYISCVIKYFDC